MRSQTELRLKYGSMEFYWKGDYEDREWAGQKFDKAIEVLKNIEEKRLKRCEHRATGVATTNEPGG